MLQSRGKIRPVAYGLALYMLLAALDCFGLGRAGSVLRFVALIPLALQLLEIRNMRLRVDGLLISHILFWLLALTSALYSVNQNRTVGSVMTLTMNYALILSLGTMQTYSETEVNFLKRALLWSSWLTVILMFFFSDVSEGGRLSLKLGAAEQDQNYIDGYFLYAFSYHCDTFRRRKKKRHLALSLILISVVLLTGSRGALLAYLITALLHIILLLKDTRRPVRNSITVCAVCVAALAVFDFVLKRMPDSVAVRFTWNYLAEKGTVGRVRIWKYLLEHFRQDPFLRMLFGHGYGTTVYVNRMNGLVAHNLYIDNLITLGVVGVILQLTMQGIVLRMQLRLKDWTIAGCYLGMIGMCMSLSLVAYKPMWNIVMMTAILAYQRSRNSGHTLDGGSASAGTPGAAGSDPNPSGGGLSASR